MGEQNKAREPQTKFKTIWTFGGEEQSFTEGIDISFLLSFFILSTIC